MYYLSDHPNPSIFGCNAGNYKLHFPNYCQWEVLLGDERKKGEKMLPLPALVCIFPASFITLRISCVWSLQKSKHQLWAGPSSMTAVCSVLFLALERTSTTSIIFKLLVTNTSLSIFVKCYMSLSLRQEGTHALLYVCELNKRWTMTNYQDFERSNVIVHW